MADSSGDEPCEDLSDVNYTALFAHENDDLSQTNHKCSLSPDPNVPDDENDNLSSDATGTFRIGEAHLVYANDAGLDMPIKQEIVDEESTAVSTSEGTAADSGEPRSWVVEGGVLQPALEDGVTVKEESMEMVESPIPETLSG